jgi:hypothetical protein
MMQTTAAQPARAQAPPPVPAAAPARPPLAERLRAQLHGTPGSLRVLAAAAVGVSLLFGVLGAATLSWRSGAISTAQANAEQLVRLQTVRTRLVQADAEAANAFLVGGLEPAVRRAAYVESTAIASSTIAEAAGRSEADAKVLAEVNRSLVRYTGLVEAARANNRQGLAVGATYLQQASALLRSDILPRLTTLSDQNQARVQDAFDTSARHGKTFGLLVLATLVALAAGQVWLALRTRRVLNVGLAAATAVVLGAIVVAASAMLWAQSRANTTHTHAYAATVELAQARIDAFDAKSAESLTLVARGSGQAYEEEFQRVTADAWLQLDAARAVTAGADEATAALDSYVAVHKRIRTADAEGRFEKAVAMATGGDANVPFARFDEVSGAELRAQSERVVDDLRSARAPLAPVAVLVLLGGLLAAAAASRGVGARLQEYR